MEEESQSQTFVPRTVRENTVRTVFCFGEVKEGYFSPDKAPSGTRGVTGYVLKSGEFHPLDTPDVVREYGGGDEAASIPPYREVESEGGEKRIQPTLQALTAEESSLYRSSKGETVAARRWGKGVGTSNSYEVSRIPHVEAGSESQDVHKKMLDKHGIETYPGANSSTMANLPEKSLATPTGKRNYARTHVDHVRRDLKKLEALTNRINVVSEQLDSAVSGESSSSGTARGSRKRGKKKDQGVESDLADELEKLTIERNEVTHALHESGIDPAKKRSGNFSEVAVTWMVGRFDTMDFEFFGRITRLVLKCNNGKYVVAIGPVPGSDVDPKTGNRVDEYRTMVCDLETWTRTASSMPPPKGGHHPSPWMTLFPDIRIDPLTAVFGIFDVHVWMATKEGRVLHHRLDTHETRELPPVDTSPTRELVNEKISAGADPKKKIFRAPHALFVGPLGCAVMVSINEFSFYFNDSNIRPAKVNLPVYDRTHVWWPACRAKRTFLILGGENGDIVRFDVDSFMSDFVAWLRTLPNEELRSIVACEGMEATADATRMFSQVSSLEKRSMYCTYMLSIGAKSGDLAEDSVAYDIHDISFSEYGIVVATDKFVQVIEYNNSTPFVIPTMSARAVELVKDLVIILDTSKNHLMIFPIGDPRRRIIYTISEEIHPDGTSRKPLWANESMIQWTTARATVCTLFLVDPPHNTTGTMCVEKEFIISSKEDQRTYMREKGGPGFGRPVRAPAGTPELMTRGGDETIDLLMSENPQNVDKGVDGEEAYYYRYDRLIDPDLAVQDLDDESKKGLSQRKIEATRKKQEALRDHYTQLNSVFDKLSRCVKSVSVFCHPPSTPEEHLREYVQSEGLERWRPLPSKKDMQHAVLSSQLGLHSGTTYTQCVQAEQSEVKATWENKAKYGILLANPGDNQHSGAASASGAASMEEEK